MSFCITSQCWVDVKQYFLILVLFRVARVSPTFPSGFGEFLTLKLHWALVPKFKHYFSHINTTVYLSSEFNKDSLCWQLKQSSLWLFSLSKKSPSDLWLIHRQTGGFHYRWLNQHKISAWQGVFTTRKFTIFFGTSVRETLGSHVHFFIIFSVFSTPAAHYYFSW